MSDPFDIGDVDYNDPFACLLLRAKLIEHRNKFLGSDVFDADLAIILSHTIGLLGAFIVEKWPEHKETRDLQS